MAKIKKKGTSGQAKNFITRTQAVRKLQISLPDFRRLCIFKGIYPREPRNKKKASKSSTPSTTFYYTKDIQYLLHEPLLAKFRDHKALSKKIARALGRGEVRDAARLEKNNAPKLSLDHIIKERYPTFHDALRDLDDALSMLFLFANLPSTATVPPKTIALCQRLCQEFQHYLITTHSLRKSFLSIKGIYYQATVQGQDILWLVPYRFVQRVTGDVDFRIMGTFVEFYTTLLGFVNFRLYTSVGLVYPPKFNVGSDESGGELGAFTLEGRGVGGSTTSVVQSDMSSSTDVAPIDMTAIRDDPNAAIAEEDSDPGKLFDDVVSDSIDKFETPAVPDADILPQPQQSSTEAGSLFANLTFYLSRETPRQPLEFLLRAFGCKRIGWDAVLGDGAFTYDESDPNVTHQIVDRPPIPLPAMDGGEIQESSEATSITKTGHRYPGRTYIQPQWVWDCVNEGKLLRPDIYAPGATLPPHLSPWVKPMKGTYDPTLSLAEQEREGEADAASELESEEGEEEEVEDTKTGKSDTGKLLERQNSEVETGEGMDVADTEDESESDAEEESALSSDGEGWDGFGDIEESEDEHETAKDAHQRELEAEAADLPFSTGSIQEMSSVKNDPKSEARKKAAKKRREEEEELERQKMMMPRKKRKILEKMLYSNRKKEEEAELLRKKRRKIEKNKA